MQDPNRRSWDCPSCHRESVIRYGEDGDITKFETDSSASGKAARAVVAGEVIICPNKDCRDYTVEMAVWINNDKENSFRRWSLVPSSGAKLFPSYIPATILEDYREACEIRDLSPRASATLARRCLQAMIRDCWGVSPGNLNREIAALEHRVDPLTWEAIEAVHNCGGVGSHMEQDTNLIVGADADEPGLLIGLIEFLLKDWYIARREREVSVRKLTEMVKRTHTERARLAGGTAGPAAV